MRSFHYPAGLLNLSLQIPSSVSESRFTLKTTIDLWNNITCRLKHPNSQPYLLQKNWNRYVYICHETTFDEIIWARIKTIIRKQHIVRICTPPGPRLSTRLPRRIRSPKWPCDDCFCLCLRCKHNIYRSNMKSTYLIYKIQNLHGKLGHIYFDGHVLKAYNKPDVDENMR